MSDGPTISGGGKITVTCPRCEMDVCWLMSPGEARETADVLLAVANRWPMIRIEVAGHG